MMSARGVKLGYMKFPTYEELKKRNTMKWTRYPEDVIPLWVAESDFQTCPPVKEAVARAVEEESFGYPPDGSPLPAATAEFYRQRYGFPAKEEWIFATPDVVRSIAIAVSHFTRPDSKVIIPVPAYPPFFQLLSATGREGVFVDARGGIDLAEVEQAFADGAGSIVLCNPFNPLGLVFEEEFLAELAELAARYQARVIVDEIHAPLVFEGRHVVAAGVSETAAKVCITATATSKAWNTAGLKCAQIIFSNPQDVARWNQLDNVSKDGVSILGLVAATAAYREGQDFLEEEIAYLRKNRDFLLEELPKAIPGAKITTPAATYLMWIDLNHTAIPGNKSEWLLNNAQVMMNDGAWFGKRGEGFVRLNFATSREILREAVDRMARAVEKL